MSEVLLFHHALGLTPGVVAFADRLREAGHTVHTPDLYDGATFDTVDEGVAHARSIGFDVLLERGRLVGESVPAEVVYAGFSLGAMPAQLLGQTRAGAKGVLLLHSAIPIDEFAESWPDGVPLQIHTMENDDWGDADVAREVATALESAEVFLYPGDKHLFTDNSRSEYDDDPAALVMSRVLDFLARIDAA